MGFACVMKIIFTVVTTVLSNEPQKVDINIPMSQKEKTKKKVEDMRERARQKVRERRKALQQEDENDYYKI